MVNLRLLEIKVIDSFTIKARFTGNLSPLIGTSNINITANEPGIPDPEVIKIKIKNEELTITTRPLTPHAAYFVTFCSTNLVPFKSKNGTAYLLEDGKTNVPMILGAEDPENRFRDILVDILKDNVYNLETGTLIRNIINAQSNSFQKLLDDIKQTKNDNYLSYTVRDEEKIRGAGPYDRLNEGGAYEVVRVGINTTGSVFSGSLLFSDFPSGPVTLQAETISTEILLPGTGESTFDNLTLTVAYSPVVKVNSIVFSYFGGSTYTYSIDSYGYQLNSPRYDQDHASTLLTLENNQIKLSDSVLEAGIVLPGPADTIIVGYEYKNLGKIISETSVAVSQIIDVTREEVPPVLTQFILRHAPVVTGADAIPSLAGVLFLDPLAVPPFSAAHPAFTKEIPFDYSGLPRRTGEFSVEYETGRVFVYGVDIDDGTGDFPPVATYKYRKYFVQDLDYIYDPTTYELVASPLRDLAGEVVKITFDYERVLIPGVDFESQVHQEAIDERIGNKINATNKITVENIPITNVFRVFNETSGEIYSVTRWSDYNIWFTYNTPPRIDDAIRERANFSQIFNEFLFVNREFTNGGGTRIFELLLSNNRIVSSTEDTLGSSYNTSVSFSRTDIFTTEIYFDGQITTVDNNTDRLDVGEYQLDYENGIVYIGVSGSQDIDIGTINYKYTVISPQNSHIISVSEIYNSINSILGINKRINYSSFDEGEITPLTIDLSDERFLTINNTTTPFIVDSGEIIVNDNIKSIRGIYDAYDLFNNAAITNFSDSATFTANVISVGLGIVKQETLTIAAGGIVTVSYVSPGAEITSVTNVLRTNDGYEWIDGQLSYTGYDITLIDDTPMPGEEVIVTYTLGLNSASTPIVDYDRGDYYIDYTYLADEILVSYEYGNNLLDFRSSGTLEEGDSYYVTYKVGALRDALLKNFGSMIEIPEVQDFDITLPRERYRDALIAALQSFTKGPTKPAISTMIEQITHIKPDIVEAAFEHWSLGVSYLNSNGINYTGNVSLMPGKFDNGILLTTPDDTVTFSVSNNIGIEEGTLEMWVIPEWSGIDNDATLEFEIYKDGNILDSSSVYIGSSSYNPSYDYNNRFTINKSDEISPIGLPSSIYTQTGAFIYYDDDVDRWMFLVKNSTATTSEYYGYITTTGEFYDVRFITDLGEINDILQSRRSSIKFDLHIDGYDLLSPDGYSEGDGYISGYSFDGITFMSDDEHYLFDFGKTEKSCRFSIYKDGSGYLNFKVLDRQHPISGRITQYKVSADISSWLAGQKHHVATSWKINSYDHKDELHLFIDGVEVPNIIKYGGRPVSTSTDLFRSVSKEILAGTLPKNIVVGSDMVTVASSNIVYSPGTDFAAEGVVAGDSLAILEPGFSIYTIDAGGVAGHYLTLTSTVPTSLTDARFSVNEYSTTVTTDVNICSNLAVALITNTVDGYVEIELPGMRADLPGYNISKNLLNQNVLTIYGPALAGDQVVIRTLGVNHRRYRDRKYVWGDISSVLKTQLPPPINLDEVAIYPVLLPLVSIGPANATLVGGEFYAAGLLATQPSSATEGRTLAIRMTGGNVDFTTPATVTVYGTTASAAPSETVTFTEPGIINTTEKFETISYIDGYVTPIITTRNSVAIEIKEAYSITYPDSNLVYPVLRYSFQSLSGSDLEGTFDGYTVTDNIGYFPASSVGQLLIISSPIGVAGTYTVTGYVDTHNITVFPVIPATFTGGVYTMFDVTMARSGFQNGFFTFEEVGSAGTPFTLKQGLYEVDYSTYLEIYFDPVSNTQAYVGSDMNGNKQANAIIDELRILSTTLTDVRIGETLADGQKSITTDYTAIRPFRKDSETLMLAHFDEFPLTNESDCWITSEKRYVQSSSSVNSEFGHSIVITDEPLVIDNSGKLFTKSEGTIEFWISPRTDTYNDPNIRVYFDASAAMLEENISLTRNVARTSAQISRVLSVRLQTDTDNNGIDYFVGGEILSDLQTIRLGTTLPAQQTPVKIEYVRTGLFGDRITIYKDIDGALKFNVRAVNIDYQVQQAIFWSRDSWHRVMATYKFNRSDNLDEIRLFVDGEERGGILFGSGLLFGQGFVFGQGFAGPNNAYLIDDINFSDPINEFFIGSDYLYAHGANARIDNLRISNISRQPVIIGNQPKDINYSSNTDLVLPVVTDNYTTYLLNFDTEVSKADDFVVLRDEVYGIFNFILNIIDSFDIVSDSARVQQILEALIYALKPAQSKVTINYLK